MKSQFNKIVIVSLCDGFSKEIGEKLSQSLGMLFCDTKDLVEYELIDKDLLKEISSKQYLDMCERKVIKHIASFENVVVAINYDYLTKNFNILKSESIVVFLKLSKTFVKGKDAISAINYTSRTQKLEDLSTITVGIRKTDGQFVAQKIIEKIGGIL